MSSTHSTHDPQTEQANPLETLRTAQRATDELAAYLDATDDDRMQSLTLDLMRAQTYLAKVQYQLSRQVIAHRRFRAQTAVA